MLGEGGKRVHTSEMKLSSTSDFHLFERPRSDPGGVLRLNCSVPCGRAQSGFSSYWFVPLLNAWGLMVCVNG